MGAVSAGYYDNRYWSMWKLPMFGCTDGAQVLKEVQACTNVFPNAYIRLVAFDASRQVQVAGFLVHRPANAKEWRQPDQRSVA
jgi:ribulose-bisphosphate carboxylase small chain